MPERYKRFGEFIRDKRLYGEGERTLKEVSQRLGISLSMLSDIENGRRSPFDNRRIEIFCDMFGLAENEKNMMYDLAAQDQHRVPHDIEDIMLHSETGELARTALRMSKAGLADEEDWKRFIRELEKKKR